MSRLHYYLEWDMLVTLAYSIVALVPSMSTTDVWRGIT